MSQYNLPEQPPITIDQEIVLNSIVMKVVESEPVIARLKAINDERLKSEDIESVLHAVGVMAFHVQMVDRSHEGGLISEITETYVLNHRHIVQTIWILQPALEVVFREVLIYRRIL